MKTLYLPIIEPGGHHDIALANKHGLRDALAMNGEVHQFDYLAVDVSVLYAETARLVSEFQPDLLLMQLHGADRLTPQNLADLRALRPGMKLANWNGDVHLHGLTAPNMLELLKQVDLQLVVNAAALPIYAEHGIRAAYWNIGYEEPNEPLPLVPAYDILFLGANYSDKRKQLGETLLQYGESHKIHVGLFGDGWDERGKLSNVYNFTEGAALYRACKIAISDNQFPEALGAFSNRLFQALADGAFVLQQRIPDIEKYAQLIPGKHFVEWQSFEDLPNLLDFWLDDVNRIARVEIAYHGCHETKSRHSFVERVKELANLLLGLKDDAA